MGSRRLLLYQTPLAFLWDCENQIIKIKRTTSIKTSICFNRGDRLLDSL
ncbi:hypothetical protein [Paraclostridium sordellii]|nr:hypothetical protein [Paeniclostridium sordellii]